MLETFAMVFLAVMFVAMLAYGTYELTSENPKIQFNQESSMPQKEIPKNIDMGALDELLKGFFQGGIPDL